MGRNETSQWSKLDNAAKIFPPTSDHQDTKVFRCACRLKEDVIPNFLQQAVEIALNDFPTYKSVIRKGLFWYYFEQSSIVPVVSKEEKSPCSILYRENEKNLLFEVTYHRNRINLEVYHAIADAVAAIQFLKHIVYIYIKLAKDELDSLELKGTAKITSLKGEDGFLKNYSNSKGKKNPSLGKAYKVKGRQIEGQVLKIINGTASTSQLLQTAHRYNTTISIYLTALLIYAISKTIPDKERNRLVVISVPVNLRPYFKSSSLSNFFSVLHVPYNINKSGSLLGERDLIEIIEYVKKFFKEELKTEKLQLRLNRLVAIENNYASRVVPLVIKKPILKIAHSVINKEVTSSLSNIGKVEVYKPFEKHIEGFDMCVSTRGVQLCACSFLDEISISFTSPFIESNVEKYFFRELSSKGINLNISTQNNWSKN